MIEVKIRYIPAGVALLAGAITCLICILRDYDVIYSLEALLLVLLIFTAIGIKSQKIIINVMHEQKEMEEERARQAEFLEAEKIRLLKEQEELGDMAEEDEESAVEEEMEE